MASDPAYKYCEPIEGQPNASKCKFCGYIINGGGITRVKNHLANIEKTKSVKMCDKVPHEVQEEMRELLYVRSQKKKERESLLSRCELTFKKV